MRPKIKTLISKRRDTKKLPWFPKFQQFIHPKKPNRAPKSKLQSRKRPTESYVPEACGFSRAMLFAPSAPRFGLGFFWEKAWKVLSFETAWETRENCFGLAVEDNIGNLLQWRLFFLLHWKTKELTESAYLLGAGEREWQKPLDYYIQRLKYITREPFIG